MTEKRQNNDILMTVDEVPGTVHIASHSQMDSRMSCSERPDTPCVGRCSTALGDEVCCGCGRTFTEVANWVCLNAAEREIVWQRLEAEGWWPRQDRR